MMCLRYNALSAKNERCFTGGTLVLDSRSFLLSVNACCVCSVAADVGQWETLQHCSDDDDDDDDDDERWKILLKNIISRNARQIQ